jgi:hypothetical protein
VEDSIAAMSADVVRSAAPAERRFRPGRRLRFRLIALAITAIGCAVLLVTSVLVGLTVADLGQPGPAARSMGDDAEWLGHAWVDGRKTQSDVDTLADRLRDTGVRDLFVHAGPFNDDGTLDPALRPRARWLTQALHTALPGIRVQAWLGAHPVPGPLQLESASTRASILIAVGAVLDEGFDGVHYDFEPVADGNVDLLTLLTATHRLTQQRHAVLSVSAVHNEPWPGLTAVAARLPGTWSVWTSRYLHEVALRVDEVAVMAYDTALPSPSSYGGYVRRATEAALLAVPASVTLLMGVPAYQDDTIVHHSRAETVPAAIRGIRLALGSGEKVGSSLPAREFGIAIYVDFTVTPDDWSSYQHDWFAPS